MSSASSQPWLSWPSELPTCREHGDMTIYNKLHDEAFIRELAQENRQKLTKAIRLAPAFKQIADKRAAVFLSGGTSADFELYDSDCDKTEFRQEFNFRYLFPINEPDCQAAIDLTNGEAYLFIPYVSDDSERWNGTRRPLSYYTERYGVTDTYYTSDVEKILQEKGINTLLTLFGENLDSGNTTRTEGKFPGIEKFQVNRDLLYPVLTEQRVFKSDKEIQLMKWANIISSQAHVYVMRHIKPGMTEMQLEALFKSWCHYFGGTRHCAYTCICGSGANGSVLHYGHAGRPNDRILKEGDTVVLDMGAEFNGYATDITRSYALSGSFTPDQAAIHTAVVAAQRAVMDAMKPGVSWPDMHRLAERVICEHLHKIGILQGGSVDEYMAAHMGAVFMPHGLGHLLGLMTHDVGGYLPGSERSKEPGLCWLRCGRSLEQGMVITVEPGIYFNDPTLDKALRNANQAKYINQDVLNRFRGSGGCRMEDDVLVTANGVENLTVLPTTVEEIEAVIKAAQKK